MQESISVATFNINGLFPSLQPNSSETALLPYARRHREICKWFEASDVDIINFQEVFTYRNLQLLRKNLPSYPYAAYRPFLLGPKGALVTFSRLPLEVTDYTSFFMPSLQVNLLKLPKASLLRSALKGVLIIRVKDVPLTLVNTHLLYNADFTWNKGSRFYEIQKAQLDSVGKIIKNEADIKPENKLLLGGDLNIEAESELAIDFLNKIQLRDLFASDTSTSFFNEYVHGSGFKKRIDYLLADSNCTILDFKRIFTQKVNLNGRSAHLSDHQGLQISIKL